MLSVFIVQWNFTIYQLNRKCSIKQWNRLSVKMINAVSMGLYEYLQCNYYNAYSNMNAYFFIQGKIIFQFCKHRIHIHTISRLLTLRCVLALCWSYLSLPDQPVGGTVWITFPFVRRVGLWLLLLSRYKADILNCVVYFKNRSFSVIKKV